MNKSIAFSVSTLAGSEFAFILLNKVNTFLYSNPYDEICFYDSQRELPIMTPRCAVYHTIDLAYFTGTVIATDIPSWQSGLSAVHKTKYIYVYDLFKFEVPTELISKINASEAKIITRNKEYADRLKALGYLNVLDVYMEDIDIAKFIELI